MLEVNQAPLNQEVGEVLSGKTEKRPPNCPDWPESGFKAHLPASPPAPLRFNLDFSHSFSQEQQMAMNTQKATQTERRETKPSNMI